MTNTQLLLSIGIPSFTVLVALLLANTRADRIEKRLDAIDTKLATHDAKFVEIMQSNHKDALEIMRQLTALHERVAVVETKQNG